MRPREAHEQPGQCHQQKGGGDVAAGSRALGCDLAQQGQVGEAHGISLAAPLGKPVQADQGGHEKQRQQRDRILEGQAGASSLGPPGRPR